MKRHIGICSILILFMVFTGYAQAQKDKSESYGQGAQKFSLATGSPGKLGLLKALAAAFTPDTKKWLFYDRQQHLAAEKKTVPKLKILFKGDKMLVNTYHVLAQPAGVTPGAESAAKFIDFVASERGQNII
jgi:hypothetical protein